MEQHSFQTRKEGQIPADFIGRRPTMEDWRQGERGYPLQDLLLRPDRVPEKDICQLIECGTEE